MAVKAKFVCYNKKETRHPEGGVSVWLVPVQASDKNPENKILGDTPYGFFEMVILNSPTEAAYFEQGKEYYLTIEKAE